MGIIKKTVRHLRKNQTESETEFWELVRKKRFKGKRFQRQYPIKYNFDNKSSFFVADFYCHEHKVIIEIDGNIHNEKEIKERDKIRDYIVNEYEYSVLRIKNTEILNNKDFVIEKLNEIIK
jgi:very-short-patch-repair endonuclease